MHHLLLAAFVLGAPDPGPKPAPTATAVVDTAIARMGGRSALDGIVRIRREMMTQWQRVSFEDRPYTDYPSYEAHFDVRDYSLRAWRNTRRFQVTNATAQPVIDIVRDSVAIRSFRDVWSPLNVAYVDERNELFTFAPERLLPLLRDAADLKALPDSTFGGVAHARVSATLNGYPSTVFIRRNDGLPAFVRFRAEQANDFGLAPWGRMEVEIWFSRWGAVSNGAMLPFQWDTRRVGRPYKRITIISATLDTVATADSFAVSDSLRTAFLQTARKPMHDLPMDSAKTLEERFVAFRTNGAPAGAIKLGGAWYLLESGQVPFNAERAAQWLEQKDNGARTAGGFVTTSASANGGLGWLVANKRTVRTAPAFEPVGNAILRNRSLVPPAAMTVARGQWQRFGSDSAYIESIDFPDAPGALYIYVPSLKYAYSGSAISPISMRVFTQRLKERGFAVERTGNMRSVLTPLPAGVLTNAGNR